MVLKAPSNNSFAPSLLHSTTESSPHQRSVSVSQLQKIDAALFESSDIAVALPIAFEQTMQEVLGLSAQVVSIVPVSNGASVAGRTLVTVALMSPETSEKVDESLGQIQQRVNGLKHKTLSKIAEVLTKEMEHELLRHLPAFPIWVEVASEPEGFCSELRRWRGEGQGCVESLLLRSSSASSSASSSPPAPAKVAQASDDKIAGHDRKDVSATVPEYPGSGQVSADKLASDREGDTAIPPGSGSGHHMSLSFITGASVGTCTAAMIVVAAAVWRWRSSSAKAAEKKQLFKGLSGTSSW